MFGFLCDAIIGPTTVQGKVALMTAAKICEEVMVPPYDRPEVINAVCGVKIILHVFENGFCLPGFVTMMSEQDMPRILGENAFKFVKEVCGKITDFEKKLQEEMNGEASSRVQPPSMGS